MGKPITTGQLIWSNHRNTEMSTPSARPVTLPHLKKLRVKSSILSKTGGPCNVALTNLLSCWASNSHGSERCALLEQDLKNCMATRVSIIDKLFSVSFELYPEMIQVLFVDRVCVYTNFFFFFSPFLFSQRKKQSKLLSTTMLLD